jgi:hypothetical protein
VTHPQTSIVQEHAIMSTVTRRDRIRRNRAGRSSVPESLTPRGRPSLLAWFQEIIRDQALHQRVMMLLVLVFAVAAMVAVVFAATAPEIVSIVNAVRPGMSGRSAEGRLGASYLLGRGHSIEDQGGSIRAPSPSAWLFVELRP